MEINKFKLWLLVLNILYLIIAFILFSGRKNFEFLIYVFVVILVLTVIFLLGSKFKFSKFVLTGLSLVGFLHMLGGLWIIDGLRLYGHYFVFGLIRYDIIIHFLGIFFGTLLFYEMLKSYLKNISSFVLFLLLFFVGIGMGGFHEIIEFLITVAVPETGIGGYSNTMFDMIANSVGALAAYGVIIWSKGN